MATFKTSVGGALIAASFAFATGPASAAVIYAQAPLDGGTGVFSNYGALGQAADDFALASDQSAVLLRWWGSYRDAGSAASDQFAIRLFDSASANVAPLFACGDAAAIPAVPCAGVVSSGTALGDSAGGPVFRFELSLGAPLDLMSGTTYILSITNENPDTEWFWLQSAPGNGGLFRMLDDEDFVQDGPNLSFALESRRQTVPEPGSLALLGIATLALVMGRRRSDRRR
jgi:hypothetical protein